MKACIRSWLLAASALLLSSCAAPPTPPETSSPAPRATLPANVEPEPTPATAAPSTPRPPALKVAFVYVGPVGDGGWTYAHDLGRRAVQQTFGDQVNITYVESVPEAQPGAPVFRRLATTGHQLIFGTAFGYMDPMAAEAARSPSVKFEHAGGYKTGTNLATYDARTYEGAYLAGIVAASMSKTGTLGFVAPIPIPEVIRNINSFTLGAQSVNPKVKTKVVWVRKWFDPPQEGRAAESLIRSGADVLFQNTDSSAVLRVASQRGKCAFGLNSDMSQYGGDAHLGSAVIDWGPYYVKTTRDVLEGRWQTGQAWLGVKDGAVDLVAISSKVPASTRAKVEAVKAGLKDGSFSIWKGPLFDQQGRQHIPPGQVATDALLETMNFYIKGVDDRLSDAMR